MSVAQDSFERLPAKGARSRRRSAWLIYGLPAALGALALLGVGGFAFLHGPTPPTPARPAPSITVTTALPVKAMWTDTLDTSGAIAPWQEAIIGSQIGGYQLTDVQVNVG